MELWACYVMLTDLRYFLPPPKMPSLLFKCNIYCFCLLSVYMTAGGQMGIMVQALVYGFEHEQ